MRYDIYKEELGKLAGESRLRRIPDEPTEGMLDLLSNDYMGVASGSLVCEPCFEGLPEELAVRYKSLLGSVSVDDDRMWSSSASRLLSARQEVFRLLEDTLEADYGHPALLFNSGYHANVGAIGGLNLPGTTYYVDKLMHASAYDGLFAARCDFQRYPHNDIERLARMLSKDREGTGVQVVVTESIFSMDGDRGRLRDLVALRSENPRMLLYVDEAHGFGCFGPHGLGLAEEEGLLEDIDILVGTFGKACGSAGAFVVAPRVLRDMMINNSRSFIFSTALPPVVILRTLTNYLRLRGAGEERRKLRHLSERVARRLGIGRPDGGSQILPLLTGSAERAVELAARWREEGLQVLPIRRPTVPPGGERLRISLSASLDEEALMEKLERVATNS